MTNKDLEKLVTWEDPFEEHPKVDVVRQFIYTLHRFKAVEVNEPYSRSTAIKLFSDLRVYWNIDDK